MDLTETENAIHALGMMLRGGFYPANTDQVPNVRPGAQTLTVVLIGNAGASFWSQFAAGEHDDRDPMDHWTRSMIEPIAAAVGARAAYPSDRPLLPFQSWARRSDAVHPSPIGLLIHPDFGLWHAYRAALLFPAKLALPNRAERPSPCFSCTDKPCLSACPVHCFGPAGFDAHACDRHLAIDAGHTCLELGCRARDACPIGSTYRYPAEQIHFHMMAFAKRAK